MEAVREDVKKVQRATHQSDIDSSGFPVDGFDGMSVTSKLDQLTGDARDEVLELVQTAEDLQEELALAEQRVVQAEHRASHAEAEMRTLGVQLSVSLSSLREVEEAARSQPPPQVLETLRVPSAPRRIPRPAAPAQESENLDWQTSLRLPSHSVGAAEHAVAFCTRLRSRARQTRLAQLPPAAAAPAATSVAGIVRAYDFGRRLQARAQRRQETTQDGDRSGRV